MTITAPFTLVRSNKSRGGGLDDFDVRDGDRVIGRIVRHPQAPREAPWFWAITAGGRKTSLADRGYAASCESAVVQFKAQLLRDDLVCRVSSIYRHRMCRHSSSGVFIAMPKFGSP